MHSTLSRVQGVFGFFTTVALSVATVVALSVLLHPADDVTSSVELKNVQVYVIIFFFRSSLSLCYDNRDERDGDGLRWLMNIPIPTVSKADHTTILPRKRNTHGSVSIWMLVWKTLLPSLNLPIPLFILHTTTDS